MFYNCLQNLKPAKLLLHKDTKKDFCLPSLFATTREDAVPSAVFRWSESSFAACGAEKSLKDLCFFHRFIYFLKALFVWLWQSDGEKWVTNGARSFCGWKELILLQLLTNTLCCVTLYYERIFYLMMVCLQSLSCIVSLRTSQQRLPKVYF